ncbi:insulinase family protein [Lactococcus kimchii]|nr:insulinase family protein [Lactococcus sp. S-13]
MLHVIKETKFKTVRLLVRFREEISPESLGKRVIISNMLETTNAVYRTGKDFSRKLSELYGASFATGVAKKGRQHLLSINMSFVNPKLVDFDTLGEAIGFLKTAIFEPDAINGEFNPQVFKREQTNLLHYLASMNDDRSYYASRKLADLFFADSKQALPSVATAELLAQENPRAVFEYYQEMLQTNAVDIFVLGDVDENRVVDLFSDFKFADRKSVSDFSGSKTDQPNSVSNFSAEKGADVFYRQSLRAVSTLTESKDVAQAILQLGYQLPVVYGDENYLTLQVMNGLLGGFAHSKLFTNVREKASLAYSISSTFDSFTGFLKIAAGIDASHYGKARALILEQVEAMKAGEFSDADLEQTKTMLRNTFFVSQDSPSNNIELEFVKALLPERFLTTERFVSELEKVSKENIQKVAQSLTLQAEYFLKSANLGQEQEGELNFEQ